MNKLNINFEAFHFIRPNLLWLLIPIALLSLFVFLKQKRDVKWKNQIAGHLQSVMILKGYEGVAKANYLHLFILTLSALALSGPTYKKFEKPGANIKTKVTIMLDASRSMKCKDISPNRITRAKQKITDLVDMNYGAETALIAYAQTAHIVMPYTSDPNIIKIQSKAINTDIMPIQGTNLEAAYQLGKQWSLKDSIPTTWVVITDDISHKERVITEAFLNSNPQLYIDFLLVSTPEGGPIPISKGRFLKNKQRQTIISKLSTEEVLLLNRHSRVTIQPVSVTQEDVDGISSNIRQRLLYQKNGEEKADDWEDMGYYLLVVIAIAMLPLFRKGSGIQWVILLLIAPLFNSCNNTHEGISNSLDETNRWHWEELWSTPDQLGMKYYHKGDTLKAMKHFKDPMWRGFLLYHQNNYEAAAAEYSKIRNSEGYLNFGMCMSELKNYSRAKEAFEHALLADPKNSNAKDNLKEINRLIEQKLKNYHEISNDEDRQNGKSQEDETLKENKGDEEQQEGKGKNPPPEENDNINPDNKGDDDYQAIDPNEPLTKEDVSSKILNQMNNDPSIFLRRKFQYDITQVKISSELKTETPW
ncbi:VWA domain-containing protein [Halosquirtibacter xylanolyticus]|uniref:vWA domain-containing protein n=1 Tax=Halosquirtibacter xylanolyticus TaxID=3374599 RepID=UPI003747A7C4|nr:VWA domain-containing protein [Prolixibacteraceae bacterium]